MSENDNLWGIKKVASELGCSVSGIDLKLKNDEYFPQPIPRKGRSVRKWKKSDVELYMGRDVNANSTSSQIAPEVLKAIQLTVIEAVQKGITNVLDTPR